MTELQFIVVFNFLSAVFLLLFSTSFIHLKAQTVFSETFNEANNSTTGNDNSNGVAWSATCPTCLSGDYWHVVSGRFEARDTNGEAVWETQSFNVSACDNVEVSFTISESGTMEACGTGCNSSDWVALQYSIDGGAWQNPSNSFFCSGSCAGRNVIAADDLASGTLNYSSGCIPAGNNMRIRIIVQCWAADEYWRVDDVSAVCACTALPIELLFFDVNQQEDHVILNWETAVEVNNDYFTVERTANFLEWEKIATVDGGGTSLEAKSYMSRDLNPKPGLYYYRLKQTDFDGNYDYSSTVALFFETNKGTLYPNPAQNFIQLYQPNLDPNELRIFDLSGKEHTHLVQFNLEESDRMNIDLSRLSTGTYFVHSTVAKYSFVKL